MTVVRAGISESELFLRLISSLLRRHAELTIPDKPGSFSPNSAQHFYKNEVLNDCWV